MRTADYEKAKTDLSRATAFALITETATGTIEYTAGGADTHSSRRQATDMRLELLGQHIRRLAAETGGFMTPEQAATLALEASAPED